ncbi:MAG TPA: FAD-dependent oxidoreductase, partial [Arthrobacter sp.]|nr:FAD-dependent oxidoreductase [Arthrobacter sp.]
MADQATAQEFDILVLGGGSGGYATALRAVQLGLTVGLIEKGKLGGTCLHNGCIPTKALLHSAELADHARDSAKYGVNVTLDSIDITAVNAYKDGIIAGKFKGLQGLIKGKKGITVIEGEGKLQGADTIVVNGTAYKGKNIVLATGSYSRTLPGLEIGGKVITSDEALTMDFIPKSAIILGGGVPLRQGCVVVNTEKLNRIRGIATRTFPLPGGRNAEAKVVEVEAGVITERAMEHAAEHGLVFATDPTSAWACTIGGNIAENAGGKDCVLYGTCIDNLVSWRMAMPSGRRWTIARTDHQLRKILFDDRVTFEVRDASGALVRGIELLGSEIRKRGLWKDITNKALGGL